MKSRFTTLDIRAVISDLRQRFLGMRVMNVYDVDSKTYLIKLAKPDMKAMILMESGIRLHSTNFEWPKNITPSSFSMKLRKHLRTRRLEKVDQLGMDRIVDLQFGSGEAAYHIILELYDRGNLVLTDYEYNILNILRPRTDKSEDVRFAVNEKYPVESAKQPEGQISQEKLMSILLSANEGDNLKKILSPNLPYGPALIDHCLLSADIPANACVGKEFHIMDGMPKLMAALDMAETLLANSNDPCKGYVIQKKEKKAVLKDEEPQELLTYFEFHPFLFRQHSNLPHIEFDTFDKAVDEFFSQIGSQKLDMKTLQQERAAMKKLEHIKKDHEKRLEGLQKEQDVDMNKASLIEINLDLVDRAIMIVRSAIANQIDWAEIHTIVKEAQIQGDPVASSIKTLKLDSNHVVLFLKDPYLDSDEEADEDDQTSVLPMKVDIDLELSAYANARKYFDKKRKAANKEQKTVDASKKALKSAEKKTFQTLKEVQTVATINKARKTYWFEKFLWFVTSENYLVIGGRDQQQNEHIVKKYLRAGDLYVHADLHGASSIILKNPTGEAVPPKSLNEAGTMALCNSAAWDAKVVTSAWWVYHHQVTKTAPSGEYLTTGSFMIRGKKNFLPPSYLIYGFAFLFKVDEDCVFRHKGERRVKGLEEDIESIADSEATEASADTESADVLEEGDSSSESDNEGSLDSENISDTQGGAQGGANSEHRTLSEVSETSVNKINYATEIDVHKVESHQENPENSGVNTEHPTSKVNFSETKDDDNKTADEESQDEEEENLFPDTNIDLKYGQGERLRLQASRTGGRTTSSGSTELEDTADSTDTHSADQPAKSARMSAKQRREMKKKAKQGRIQGDIEETEGSETSTQQEQQKEQQAQEQQHQEQPHQEQQAQEQQHQEQPHQEQQVPEQQPEEQHAAQVEDKTTKKQPQLPDPPQHKRRQKAKLKKIEEKYKDQDEEERRLKMEILASAGPQKEKKEDKKKGKKRKQQQHGQPQSGQGPAQGQGQGAQQAKGYPHRRLTIDDIKAEEPMISEAVDGVNTVGTVAAPIKEDDALSDEEKQTLLEEENIKIGQDLNELDSLTGLPVSEDILHFCIPVCGPYSSLLNYKYKVKLTPGSTKRGKAAKSSVYSFAHDRNATNREKDLFKSLKDVDLSRNLPGKVKVSGANLQKQKKK